MIIFLLRLSPAELLDGNNAASGTSVRSAASSRESWVATLEWHHASGRSLKSLRGVWFSMPVFEAKPEALDQVAVAERNQLRELRRIIVRVLVVHGDVFLI